MSRDYFKKATKRLCAYFLSNCVNLGYVSCGLLLLVAHVFINEINVNGQGCRCSLGNIVHEYNVGKGSVDWFRPSYSPSRGYSIAKVFILSGNDFYVCTRGR